ncbi:MAG: hypothetical protein JWR19_4631 [Pedosphaera sp.]|nr:hypothetical protein [Pedosphaera sp.]
MTETQAKVAPKASLARRILLRIFWFLVVALIVGTTFKFITDCSNKATGPAGFERGLLHGALMPGALPNLIIGRDVSIYAVVNTGRMYKLGYTMGVNGCGMIFFGIFFWRVNRWRKRVQGK